MTQKISFNLAHRGLNAEQSAKYIGISKNQFLKEVKQGKWGNPDYSRPKRRIWDRHDLDRQMDKRFAINSKYNPTDTKNWVDHINKKRSDHNDKSKT